MNPDPDKPEPGLAGSVGWTLARLLLYVAAWIVTVNALAAMSKLWRY